jgi:hypothetical protein
MKTAIFIAALALAFPATAQEKKPAAAEKPAAEKPATPAKKGSPAKRQQDARHCLGEPSNTAIIKCAEAYL